MKKSDGTDDQIIRQIDKINDTNSALKKILEDIERGGQGIKMSEKKSLIRTISEYLRKKWTN